MAEFVVGELGERVTTRATHKENDERRLRNRLGDYERRRSGDKCLNGRTTTRPIATGAGCTAVTILLGGVLVFVGATVKMGKRTFFGHIHAIWATEPARDMRDGVGDTAAPVVKKVKRGVEAGVREASKDPAPRGP